MEQSPAVDCQRTEEKNQSFKQVREKEHAIIRGPHAMLDWGREPNFHNWGCRRREVRT